MGKVVGMIVIEVIYYQQERFSSFGTSATNSGFTAFSGTNLITGQTSGATRTPSSIQK